MKTEERKKEGVNIVGRCGIYDTIKGNESHAEDFNIEI